MPKVEQSRIYLECNKFDDYFEEMHKAITIIDKPRVIVWDQTNLDEVDSISNLYSLYLSANKSNSEGRRIFNRMICGQLLKYCWHNMKYLYLGCWKGESDLIKEAESLKPIKVNEEEDQIEFIFKIDNNLKQNVLNNYLNEEHEVKWFNAMLSLDMNTENWKFSSSHHGEEYFIFSLLENEVEDLISIVENYYFYARINKFVPRSTEKNL